MADIVFFWVHVGLVISFFWALPQRFFRWYNRPWSNLIAVLMMFIHGTMIAALASYWLITMDDEELTRTMFWYYFASPSIVVPFSIFWFFTGVNLAIWIGLEFFRDEEGPSPSSSPNSLLKPVIPILLLVTGTVAWCLGSYDTLQDAVESENIPLTKKRLRFNLLGVDAQTGCVSHSTAGTTATSLVPVAVRHGKIDMVELLLEHGGDPSDGIRDAAGQKTLDILRMLLDRGGDPNRGIQRAVWNDSEDTLQVLFDYDADPTEGVHDAVKGNHRSILQVLLDRGADPFVLDWQGRTPLQVAEFLGHTEITECLRAAIQSRAAEPESPGASPPAKLPSPAPGGSES